MRSHPDSTTARATSARTERSFRLSTSIREPFSGGLFRNHAADAGHLLQTPLDSRPIENAIAAGNFHEHRFAAARPILQIMDGIGRDQLALVDDDHVLAGLFHFGQDVSTEQDGVIAGEIPDQIAGLVDLFGIESGGGFVEDQHVGIVDDRLRQTYALAIAFRELADQLGPNVS